MLASVAASKATKKPPRPSAPSSASPTPAASRPRPAGRAEPGVHEASATPRNATNSPTPWIHDGSSPRATPTMTGTTAPVAVIGATMLMSPTVMPW